MSTARQLVAPHALVTLALPGRHGTDLWMANSLTPLCMCSPALLVMCQLALQVPPLRLPLTVRQCLLGEVYQNQEYCVVCISPQYSFNAANSTCESACPANADCSGGADVTPREGYWKSAFNSDSIVACPVSNACQGNRTNLQLCSAVAANALDSSSNAYVSNCKLCK